MNDELIVAAALNNVLQSEAVLEALGPPGTFTGNFWTNRHCRDIPYANGATFGPESHPGEHLEAVERLTAARPPGAATYVMDSWAALDLTPLGYRIRFTDEWFIRSGPAGLSGPQSANDVRPITSVTELAEFERASVLGFDDPLPDAAPGHTYAPTLLDDARFQFFGLYVDEILASGLFLFSDPRCTGVFTFFTLPEYRGQGHATRLLQTALTHAPDLPIATNPSSMSRGIFSKLGFQPTGERQLWAR